MGTDYNHEIGYETLQKDFKRYQKETPKGVSLQNKRGKTIILKFKINGESKSKGCNCSFTLDGMVEALRKSKLVAEKLKTCTSEVEFEQWYEAEILDKNTIIDDRITFGEAIQKVEDDFWNRLSRTKQKRSKDNPSDINSWRETYGKFYKHASLEKPFDANGVQNVLARYKKGTKTFKYAVSALKKLARLNKRQDILNILDDIDVTQTEFTKLQTIDLKQFIDWRDKTLGITASLHKNSKIETRKSWLWAFSVQIVYGLRISEVFAIKNLLESYVTKDGVVIPALSDPSNTSNLIYIGEKTILGTKVKTGGRLARPMIPPKYPDLINRLEIKTPLLPTARPKSNKPETLVKFFSKEARTKMLRWNAPFTQTHADRHLGNINGMQAGIPQEVRAQSMGHTPAMNDSVYKKRQSTQTTIDLLLVSNTNAIDFVTALAEAQKLVISEPDKKEYTVRLLSIIYQKDIKAIAELF